MADITAIGEILTDMTQTGTDARGIPLFAANPGGAPANVAVAAARLGASSAFIGKTGRDALGRQLIDTLIRNGVDAGGVSLCDQPTTMALVALSPEGERSFTFLRGADRLLKPEEISLPADLKVLHFGSVSLTADPARTATLAAVRIARAQGKIVSYDPNYRPTLWPSREEAVRWMKEPLELVDILKLSDEELPLLTGTSDPETGSLILAQAGIPLILITLGARGVYYRWREHTGTLPGVPVSVADTNGAGDTFLGAVLSRLVTRREDILEHLTVPILEDILVFANHAAAITCSRPGAIPAMPTLSKVLDSLSEIS